MYVEIVESEDMCEDVKMCAFLGIFVRQNTISNRIMSKHEVVPMNKGQRHLVLISKNVGAICFGCICARPVENEST